MDVFGVAPIYKLHRRMEMKCLVILIMPCYFGSVGSSIDRCTVCTVQHSAAVLIFEDPQCGWQVDHSLLAWEGAIFPLDVCHVDKTVAGKKSMNNP